MSYDSWEVPDGIEPMTGYRGWLVKNDRLVSCYREVDWPTRGSMRSECILPTFRIKNDTHPSLGIHPPRHDRPIKDCSCGFYAMHEFPKVWEVREGERRPSFKPWPAEALVGVMEGWGHVVVGTKGFRAEYARPIALVSRPRSKKLTPVIEELAELYGLDIVEARDIRLGEYPREMIR